MRLLLIRHGETTSNLTGALDTQSPGAPLTSLGQAQASAIAPALLSRGLMPTAIYSSPLLRAAATAANLGEALGVEVRMLEGLREISAGDLEMRTDGVGGLAYVDLMIDWMRGERDAELPGGTTLRQFMEAFGGAVETIASEQAGRGVVAVVTHGAAMRVWAAVAAGFGPDAAAQMWVENTGMAVVDRKSAGDWEVVEWVPQPVGGSHLRNSQGEDVPVTVNADP